jgi:CRP/FNR family transcriptional regulator
LSRTIEQIIGRCQFFAEVDGARRRQLAEMSLVRKFAKGELIFRQGDDCPGVYIVDTGMVRVFNTATSGKEHVLHMVGPGRTFAEVAAIGEFACPANAEAIAATTCVLLPQAPFHRMMTTDHQLCLEMMTGMSFWVRHLISLMEDIVLRDAIGRVARFLLEATGDQDGMVRLPGLKRHVASHLNLTSETFSRTLGRLIEGGLIAERDNHHVELRDPDRLRAIAEGMFPQL